MRLAKIVHAADVAADIDTDPIARGFEAIAVGYSLRYPEDEENLAHQFEVYVRCMPGVACNRLGSNRAVFERVEDAAQRQNGNHDKVYVAVLVEITAVSEPSRTMPTK